MIRYIFHWSTAAKMILGIGIKSNPGAIFLNI